MKLDRTTVALALAGVCWSGAALSQPTEPPAQPEPELPAAAQPQPPPPAPLKAAPKPAEPPKTVGVEPATADSAALTSSAASAEISGDSQQALELAKRATKADPRDPWAYYVRGSALSSIGHVDDALKAYRAAEDRFAISDVWARSVAIYGAAHTLAEVGRCEEARVEFNRYSVYVRERDPKAAEMATRYGANCKPPTEAPAPAPAPKP